MNSEIYSNIQQSVEGLGYILYDIQSLKELDEQILRVYILNKDTKEAITLLDCQKVSKVLNYYLDTNEPFGEEYFLEVSSIGVERELKEPMHFYYSIGDYVKIKTTKSQKLKGLIKDFKDNILTLQIDASKKAINPNKRLKKRQRLALQKEIQETTFKQDDEYKPNSDGDVEIKYSDISKARTYFKWQS